MSEHSSAVSPVGQLSNTSIAYDSSYSAPTSFDITAAATQADRDHAVQVAAEEEAARAAEVECREQALQSRDEWLAQGDRPTHLEEVDWNVSRDEFLETWTARIDAFLEGSNLAGYGSVFAEAAWENGVDPRFSPAIANTESGRGEICFLPYNAWGWGACVWSNWEEAIESHVSGLAEGYGYCVTLSGAASYCPPTYTDWYATVQSQIELI